MQTSNPFPIEKILSALSYITAGGVGFVWLIIAAVTKKIVRPFLMYHIMQSIFISILFFLLQVFFELLEKIPLLNLIPYLLNMPINFVLELSLMQLCTTAIILYATITSFIGYYTYIPWISDIINGNVRR
ncbi:hypothetical protein IJO12_08225 [bacterium]|nr:hypothetical protein [bacterium]